ncbi:MAG: hypothetical protein ACOYB8_03985 [Eubacteriaceae bacterium]|jgi:hypothetical protein
MKFSELKAVMSPESRLIFRIFSDTAETIDSGAVVLFNVTGLDDAQVLLVYTQTCIQHVDLKIPLEAFNKANWEQIFGKSVFVHKDGDHPFPTTFQENGITEEL